MVSINECIKIKSNNRVLFCLDHNGKPKYRYLGKLNQSKKSFFTFRSITGINQKISIPFSLIKKLSVEGFSISVKIPGKHLNISALDFLLNAQLDNRISEYREIRMSLPLSEFNTGSIKSADQSNNINKYSNKLKNAKAV